MKKLLLSCFLLTQLSGCAVYNAFFMAKYDNNEYELVTHIRTIAQTVDCENNISLIDSSDQVWFLSNELVNYTQYQPRNEKSNEMAVNLNSIAKGLHDKNGKMSKLYCEEKFNIIKTSAEDIQRVTGSRPR